MFTAALFKDKTWKRVRCLPVSEQINKLWYSQAVGRYSVLKGNVLSSHVRTRADLNAYYLVEEARLKRLYTI